jgi:hypothetical protein
MFRGCRQARRRARNPTGAGLRWKRRSAPGPLVAREASAKTLLPRRNLSCPAPFRNGRRRVEVVGAGEKRARFTRDSQHRQPRDHWPKQICPADLEQTSTFASAEKISGTEQRCESLCGPCGRHAHGHIFRKCRPRRKVSVGHPEYSLVFKPLSFWARRVPHRALLLGVTELTELPHPVRG